MNTNHPRSLRYACHMYGSGAKPSELNKSCFIIFKGKGISDNSPILIHDKAVMFEFGNIDANKICHDDTSCK